MSVAGTLAHVVEWILLVVLYGLSYGAGFLPAYRRPVFPEDFALLHLRAPVRRNTIPAWTIPLFAVVGVFLILAVFTQPWRRDPRYRRDLHASFLGLAASVAFTMAIANVTRVCVGRLRPNIVHLCWPYTEPRWADEANGVPKCTGGRMREQLARTSFPSGHAAHAAAGLVYLTWYMFGWFGVFSPVSSPEGRAGRALLSLLPTFLAGWVGFTRIEDDWHHPTDVAAGFFLGLVVSLMAYRMYFPVPWDSVAGAMRDASGTVPHASFLATWMAREEGLEPTLGLPSYHPLPENIEEARDERPAPRSNARGQEPGGSPPAITMRAGGGKGGPRPQEA